MKRDMDLVRAILLAMEDHSEGFAPDVIDVPGFSKDQIRYHAYLLGQANLMDVAVTTTMSDQSPQAMPVSLTWAGHEFLANAREEKNWLQAKRLMKGAGAASFHVWQSVLTSLVMKNLGL